MEKVKGSEIEKLRARVAELEKQVDYENELQKEMEKLKVVELEKLQTTVGELQKQLDYKTELRNEVEVIEAEVEKLRTKFASLKKQTDEVKRLEDTVDELTKSLSESIECIEGLEDLNKNLIVKERLDNDELQQARKSLIHSAHCGKALKRKCRSSLADVIADESVMLCNFWEKMLKNQAWHPFKQVTLVDGKYQELIDEEDTLFKILKNEWGKIAYSAVVNALVEMNEYNPSGRIPVQKLWNFKEKRRATVKEGVAAVTHRLRRSILQLVLQLLSKSDLEPRFYACLLEQFCCAIIVRCYRNEVLEIYFVKLTL
ncbi:hypothetical protein MKW98_008501 [Papaver atlanticum]|uniref:Factor of DNA methylation 1-5/IDN2 domain-containing protein n=1 Tax=Papaver atlanticum TaxID=357466 RepID=A0AAD4TDA3_9MAGN|nr:hypothetical protein MKW98_008501 [Papaver atlanticum]